MRLLHGTSFLYPMLAMIQNTDDYIFFCRNFKRMVLSAYQWLSENYEEGDRIFLFGMSRLTYPCPTNIVHGDRFPRFLSWSISNPCHCRHDRKSMSMENRYCTRQLNISNQVGLLHKGNNNQIALCVVFGTGTFSRINSDFL